LAWGSGALPPGPRRRPRRRAPRGRRTIESWRQVGGLVLHEEETFIAARDEDRAALEERIVAPRPSEARGLGTDRHGVEEPDFLRLGPVADVHDTEPAGVVRVVHPV